MKRAVIKTDAFFFKSANRYKHHTKIWTLENGIAFEAYSTQKNLTNRPHTNNDLVVTNQYDEGSPAEDLYSLLERGANVGVHTNII